MAEHRRTTAWELADQHRSQSTHRPRQKPAATTTPRMKDHFPKVVQFVYASRYATGDQVQARFPKIFTSDRTCRRHLKQLVDMGYLACADVKSTGVNWPLVYLCTIKGTKLLREHFNVELANAREEAKSLASIEHELFLTEFDLACLATVGSQPHLDIQYQERRYMHQDKRLKFSTTTDGKSSTKHLIPDAGFMLTVTRLEQMANLQFFVELDNGTELPSVVLAKFNTYFNWASSSEGSSYLTALYRRYGSKNPKVVFRLLVIARRRGLAGTDHQRLADLFVQSLHVHDGLRQLMWFTTVDLLKAHQHDTPPLKSPLWIKGKDADAWLDEYRTFAESITNEKGSRPGKLKREFVAARLPTMPHHVLFPPATV